MTIKRKNDKFVVTTLKHVNHLGTVKIWAIAHENGHKRENDEFLVTRTCMGSYGHANPPRAAKLWVIPHENGHKTRK